MRDSADFDNGVVFGWVSMAVALFAFAALYLLAGGGLK